jgi:hypothetical protein
MRSAAQLACERRRFGRGRWPSPGWPNLSVFRRKREGSLACSDFRDVIGPVSDPIASLPDEENESRDQSSRNEHPVLTFETQKGKTLNKKLHYFRSLFCAG